MLHVDAFIEDLAEADRDRLQDAKQSIQQGRAKIGIVNEIVRNTVDVPGNADRVNKTEGQHSPKWETREKVKHPEEVGAVENSGQYWNGIPSGVGKHFGARLPPLHRPIARFHLANISFVILIDSTTNRRTPGSVGENSL